jgi:inhibitor of KinA sporulation pathway (predicted exonuclease)
MSLPEFICVLDFEATCEENVKHFDNEIIEFPSVLLKYDDDSQVNPARSNNYIVISEFQQFCKPLKNPVVSKFCNELTGITQEQVNKGNNFISTLNDHHHWLINQTGGWCDNVLILTCGFWDLGKVMIEECKKWKIIPPKVYMHFINIKNDFKKFYKIEKGLSMVRMLEILNITLEGHHHSGIDDCRNIAKIWKKMVLDGYIMPDESVIKIDPISYKTKYSNQEKKCKNPMKT